MWVTVGTRPIFAVIGTAIQGGRHYLHFADGETESHVTSLRALEAAGGKVYLGFHFKGHQSLRPSAASISSPCDKHVLSKHGKKTASALLEFSLGRKTAEVKSFAFEC